MSKKHMVRIERSTNLRDMTVSVSQGIARELQLTDGGVTTVLFGQKAARCRVTVASSGNERRLYFPAPVLSELKCPAGISVHIQPVSGAGFKIGPVMGILAPRYGVGRFGAHTPYIRQLLRFSRRLGIIAFVFSPRDVNFDDDATNGFVLKTGGWRRQSFPLPDVVYDRIPSRRIDALASVRDLKERLRGMEGVVCINDRFMDKWRVHRSLSEDSTASKYLPKTRQYDGEDDLRSFLTKYRRVYLKPTGGSQGHGIIKITRISSEKFQYVISGKGCGYALGYSSLAKKVQRHISGRRYIIQQGLHLATVGGRHFDIRLLMQKDSSGKWLSTKVYARWAAAGRITSNISTGAEGVPMGAVLRRAFGKNARGIAARVRAAGRKLPPIIERELGLNFGELGLDIGVDTSGKIWLIEVNSKPFRHMTTEKGSKLAIIRSVLRPLSYTLGVSGFHKMKKAPIEEGDSEHGD